MKQADSDHVYRSDLKYTDRASKAGYVFDKYQSLLAGRVLDVGADGMFLKPLVSTRGGSYVGIGFGNGIDIEYNLENHPLPFPDRSFDTVLCFDVLEHLENIHSALDELFRLSNHNVIISLPNPWSDFFSVLRGNDHSAEQKLKFYGLPPQKPLDRHRWFFNESEAKSFVETGASRNGFELTQFETIGGNKPMGGSGLKGFFGRMILRTLLRKDIESLALHHSTMWFVLTRENNQRGAIR